jgi:protoporphyrinogen oxidase
MYVSSLYQISVGNRDLTKAAVLIIGAGISGICIAIDLIKRNKCHNFIIVEKGSGPGGTWKDNTYPGITSNDAYMFYRANIVKVAVVMVILLLKDSKPLWLLTNITQSKVFFIRTHLSKRPIGREYILDRRKSW